MIRIFRKSWRRLRRMVCAALCLVLLSSLLAVPVGAADIASSVSFAGYVRSPSLSSSFRGGSFSSPANGSSAEVSLAPVNGNSFDFQLSRFYFYPGGSQSGAVIDGSFGLYFSFFPYAVTDQEYFVSSPNFSPSDFTLSYVDSSSASYTIPASIELTSNYPTFSLPDTYARGTLYSMKVRGNVSSLVNAVRFDLYFPALWYYFSPVSSSAPDISSVYLRMPSIALISGVSSSDLGALEGIADGIAAQSQILNSMYGDIMELLNDLYARLGDMQSVEELTNTYFAQLIPLVNSININTANIYSLLQTQFQLLRTLIATESGDIQAAIEKQTDDLIAYFDTVFSGATGDMPEKSDDLQSSVGDFSDAESGYQSNATQRFEELASTFSGFTGGTLAGVTLASTLFTRVWNALGQYNIVYYFPLLLGLSLVIIGRLPRGSGGQSSSEKHRGDSSA